MISVESLNRRFPKYPVTVEDKGTAAPSLMNIDFKPLLEKPADGRETVALFTGPAALLPLALPDCEMVPALNEAQIDTLYVRLAHAVNAMDEARDYLALLAGPNPGPLAAQMLAGINYGAGHFRHCRDTLMRLQRARNTALAVAQEAAK